MTQPIIGYRTWNIAHGRAEFPWPQRSPVSKHIGQPELDAWLEKTQKASKPTVTVQKLRYEAGTLLPVRTPDKTWALPGVVRFRCKVHSEQPARDCMCGLYARFEDDDTNSYGAVVGAIIAWGHIILHGGEGFRAECARIVALAPTGKKPEALTRLAAERLGVPLVTRARLPLVASEFGVHVTWEYHFGA